MPSKMRRFEIEQVASNGLLDRRALLGRGVMLAGAMGAGTVGATTGAAAEPLKDAFAQTYKFVAAAAKAKGVKLE